MTAPDLHSETLACTTARRAKCAAEPGRTAKIVLDSRAHTSLTAGSFSLNHHRVQALGRSINGSGEAGWPSAYNCQVIEAGLGPSPQTNLLRDVRRHTL
jgi:hypothetical protein